MRTFTQTVWKLKGEHGLMAFVAVKYMLVKIDATRLLFIHQMVFSYLYQKFPHLQACCALLRHKVEQSANHFGLAPQQLAQQLGHKDHCWDSKGWLKSVSNSQTISKVFKRFVLLLDLRTSRCFCALGPLKPTIFPQRRRGGVWHGTPMALGIWCPQRTRIQKMPKIHGVLFPRSKTRAALCFYWEDLFFGNVLVYF